MVRVLEFGAEKYASHNWKKGLPTTEVCESMLRHTYAYLEGEDIDKESGLSHIGHIQCNAMFLSRMAYGEHDDRYVDPNQLEMFDLSKLGGRSLTRGEVYAAAQKAGLIVKDE